MAASSEGSLKTPPPAPSPQRRGGARPSALSLRCGEAPRCFSPFPLRGGGRGECFVRIPWRRGPTVKLSFLFYAPVPDLGELDRRMGRIAALGYQGIELTASHPLPYPIDEVIALTRKHGLPV